MPEITAERMIAQYFDTDALVEPNYRVYRLNNKGQRWYYRILPDGTSKYYMSVTTLCNATLPTPRQLIDWIANMGVEEAHKYSNIRAHYGTLMHLLCGQLMIDKSIDLDRFEDIVKGYQVSEGLESHDVKFWADDLRKDILSFHQFISETNFKPLAIEVVLVHPDGYAGAIDLVGEMNVEVKGFFGETYKSGEKKGEPKESKQIQRIRAIIDLKSGKKSFYESHEIQLRAYREMWNYNYPDKQVDRVFNWSPKEWRTKPDYNIKDQTDAKSGDKWQYIKAIAAVEMAKREKTALQITGTLKLSESSDSNYRMIGFDEVVKCLGES